MNAVVSLQVDQNLLFQNLRHAFSAGAVIGELLQNARRAGATSVAVTYDPTTKTLSVEDDGEGIADLQNLLTAAASGWSDDVMAVEHPFGLGFLSTLYVCDRIDVDTCSNGVASSISACTQELLRGGECVVAPGARRRGTRITLVDASGIQASVNEEAMMAAVADAADGFPIPVTMNGVGCLRRYAVDQITGWTDTEVGKVHVELSRSDLAPRRYVQGLPLACNKEWKTDGHVVHLNDTFTAKLPDRRFLVDDVESTNRIGEAVGRVARGLLERIKASMAGDMFVAEWWPTVTAWGCGDLLHDIDVVPVCWFVDWERSSAGFMCESGSVRFKEVGGSKLVSRATLLESGVFRLPGESDDEQPAFAAQLWLEATRRWTLACDSRTSTGHWLSEMAVDLGEESFSVDADEVVGGEAVSLDGWTVSGLDVAARIRVTREATGESVEVPMAVKDGTLLVTKDSGVPSAATRLVSDYIFDNGYEEAAESRDMRRLEAAFLRITANTPAEMVAAVLRQVQGLRLQGRLAGLSFTIRFDDKGTFRDASPAADEGLHYFAVTGRIPGDDEDTTHLYQAEDREHAVEQFKDEMWSGRDAEERTATEESDGTDTYVTSVIVSDAPLRAA